MTEVKEQNHFRISQRKRPESRFVGSGLLCFCYRALLAFTIPVSSTFGPMHDIVRLPPHEQPESARFHPSLRWFWRPLKYDRMHVQIGRWFQKHV